MSKRKKIKDKPAAENLSDKIKKLARGLYYTSETDAEILPFSGEKANSVSKEEIEAQTSSKPDQAIEERSFDDFFSRLTEIQDWFGEEEKRTAQKFSALRELLQTELKNLKVFKIGAIELDIYVVGLDAQGILCGIKTKAVET